MKLSEHIYFTILIILPMAGLIFYPLYFFLEHHSCFFNVAMSVQDKFLYFIPMILFVFIFQIITVVICYKRFFAIDEEVREEINVEHG